MEHYCICFAGVPGSGKSPVANYISYRFGVPRFERDGIRNEVREDFQIYSLADSAEALATFDAVAVGRQKKMTAAGITFVLDCSVDRTWPPTKALLEENDYHWILISFDLSEAFQKSIHHSNQSYHAGEYARWKADHDSFLELHASDISIVLNDENYWDRMSLIEKYLIKEGMQPW